jgi:hypothetical protein
MMIAAAASFLAGSFGYILFQFWLRPMLRYRAIKRRVARALAGRPAGEPGADGSAAETGSTKTTAGRESLRQLAAALSACYSEQLPDWYQLLLKRRNELPLDAAAYLMKLSGTRHSGHAERQVEAIRRSLNLTRPSSH